MSQDREEQRSAELLSLLGEQDFLRLVENYGGTRIYVPAGAASQSGEATQLAEDLGEAVAMKLARHHAGSYLRVPLARETRARHYRAAGNSNAQIARRLGITETGVDKLFRRMPDKPVKGSADSRQMSLFSK